MLVVPVKTDALEAEVLHLSVVPEKLRQDIYLDSMSPVHEIFLMMAACIIDPAKSEAFESLKYSEALAFYNKFRLTQPIEKDITDGLLA